MRVGACRITQFANPFLEGSTSVASPAFPHPPLAVEVWGPLACFTRPELKVERVSYPVATPSALNGVLQAIFWKPEFEYQITQIEVLAPIEWTAVRRNEVKSVVNPDQVRKLQADRTLRYDVERDRDQRATMALRNVAYRVHAQVRLKKHADGPEAKYREQLRRRVERGACFSQPFLGTREFSASFGPVGSAPVPGQPIKRDEELGVMLHSIQYTDQGERYRFFRASMISGVIEVTDPLGPNEVAMPSGTWRRGA
ncbi:type I-C CRISPR-associated protein Cas5 [Streptomyces lunaelactis]|uniref:pre-crRNA processing endonuclease n=1 Tax=Streptomyces lunaelactis TaxID=1535768 RepID=A0A2R4SW39_9ACTN|nr:type I-C CRISPR-associated protein Cas5 [Streptomyces lunaelactis]NUK22777.1 type I-C CRISPR-associated protein Cas5 [Streptomyces lunaelactis]NUK85016.1 type I-C CRISPR-associated protein Cas5 [Streptomyces lunaelactis]